MIAKVTLRIEITRRLDRAHGKVGLGCGSGREGDGVPALLELLNEPLGASVGITAREVLAAEVAVDLAGAEHVPDGADDGVLDRAERFLMTALWP